MTDRADGPHEGDRLYHIGFAKVAPDGLFDTLTAEALTESWVPGASVTRYGRKWHLSKLIEKGPDYYVGRIGFDDDEQKTLSFDYETNDFVYGEVSSGVVVPFCVRLADGVTAFQLRPGVVRETTFTGALQELLNVESRAYSWTVKSFVETKTFGAWRKQIQAVTRFDFTLRKPNPHYADREQIESMIEDVRLESMRLVGKALVDESIDTGSALFQQALDHVVHEYGRAKVAGTDQDGTETVWVKLRGWLGQVGSKRTMRAPGGEQTPTPVLKEALTSGVMGQELADLNAEESEV